MFMVRRASQRRPKSAARLFSSLIATVIAVSTGLVDAPIAAAAAGGIQGFVSADQYGGPFLVGAPVYLYLNGAYTGRNGKADNMANWKFYNVPAGKWYRVRAIVPIGSGQCQMNYSGFVNVVANTFTVANITNATASTDCRA